MLNKHLAYQMTHTTYTKRKVEPTTLVGIIDNERKRSKCCVCGFTLFWIHVATLAVIKKLKCNVIWLYLSLEFRMAASFLSFDLCYEYTAHRFELGKENGRIYRETFLE